MATEEKSIEISYKANLKDLLAKLKSIPGITAEEAKKMATALDRQLKQAEKASKKSAQATQKAMRQTAKLARVGNKALQDIEKGAGRAEQKLENVAEASGDIDRGFSSIGLALREVNPKLAEASDGLADTFAVVEGLSMSFKNLNPYVVAASVAIGALTLGYQSHKKELEKIKEITLEYRDAQKALADTQKAQADNLREAGSTIRELREELALVTGTISEYDYAIGKAGQDAFSAIEDNIESQNELIKAKERELDLVGRLYLSARDLSRSEVALSQEQKDQLRTLQLQTKAVSNRLDLSKRDEKTMQAFLDIQDTINAQLVEMKRNRKGLENMQKSAVEMAEQLADFQFEQAEEAERIAKAEEKRLENQEEINKQAELENKIRKDLDAFYEKQAQSEASLAITRERLADSLKKITEDEIGQINLKYDTEIKKLQELAEQAETTAGLQEGLDALEFQRRKDIEDYKQKKHKEHIQRIREETFAFTNQFSQMLGASVDFIEARTEGEKEGALKIFRLRQAEALASIAISTAEGIAKAQAKYPGLVGGLLAAGITGVGIAQAGVVLSQQPPSYHMGGIAPDETRATLLQGEAVLDRATVRRIGGNEGVKQLQQGQPPQDKIIIIQPFKHFGRFAKEIGFKTPKQTGIRGY